MIITADTNVLVRAAASDDPIQSPIAQSLLREADGVVIPLVVCCEFVWVLSRVYRQPATVIASALRALAQSDKVRMDRDAVDAGLIGMERGCDFADAVIAFAGARDGADVFASFDREALRQAAHAGCNTLDLNAMPSPL